MSGNYILKPRACLVIGHSFRQLLFIAACLLGVVAGPSHAKLFSNAYISFELPPNWDCKLEGTEWLCVSKFSPKNKEAIIVLTAKAAGPSDTFANFQAHLKTSRPLPNLAGKIIPSKVYQITTKQISGHTWVDGLQMGSEVPEYYSRYMATVKDKMALLISFSAYRGEFTKYTNDFYRAMESVRVMSAKDLPEARAAQLARSNTETIGTPIGETMPAIGGPDVIPEEDNLPRSNNQTTWIGLIFILLGICLYGYFKFKKK